MTARRPNVPLPDLSYYQTIPSNERGKRIAELLIKAVRRYYAAQRAAEVTGTAKEPPAEPFRDIADDAERKILRHLAMAESAAPRDLCLVLGLHRRTIAHRLRRLREAGLVVVSGNARDARYQLREPPDPNKPRDR